MADIIESMHIQERKEIDERNKKYIKQITEGLAAANTDMKVRYLVNALARIYDDKRSWLYANPHKLEDVEKVITEQWNLIKNADTIIMRNDNVGRVLARSAQKDIEKFKLLVSKVLND
jgi:hypothetical protein